MAKSDTAKSQPLENMPFFLIGPPIMRRILRPCLHNNLSAIAVAAFLSSLKSEHDDDIAFCIRDIFIEAVFRPRDTGAACQNSPLRNQSAGGNY